MAGVNILFYFNPLNKRSSESLCTQAFQTTVFGIKLNPWEKPRLQTFRQATVAWALPAKYGRSKQEGCNVVIPAQAGIQASVFWEDFKDAATSNF